MLGWVLFVVLQVNCFYGMGVKVRLSNNFDSTLDAARFYYSSFMSFFRLAFLL